MISERWELSICGCSYPALDTCRAIAENLIMTAITICSVVLATVPDLLFGSGTCSIRNWTVETGLHTRTSRTSGNWPVLPTKTHHVRMKIMPPFKNRSSDCILTWSIFRLCSFGSFDSSHCQIRNQTNILWVSIQDRRILLKIWGYVMVIQEIFVWSGFWK